MCFFIVAPLFSRAVTTFASFTKALFFLRTDRRFVAMFRPGGRGGRQNVHSVSLTDQMMSFEGVILDQTNTNQLHTGST